MFGETNRAWIVVRWHRVPAILAQVKVDVPVRQFCCARISNVEMEVDEDVGPSLIRFLVE